MHPYSTWLLNGQFMVRYSYRCMAFSRVMWNVNWPETKNITFNLWLLKVFFVQSYPMPVFMLLKNHLISQKQSWLTEKAVWVWSRLPLIVTRHSCNKNYEDLFNFFYSLWIPISWCIEKLNLSWNNFLMAFNVYLL